MKKRKMTNIILIVLAVILVFGLWFYNYNKIVGTVKGPEMQKIIIKDITYTWWSGDDACPYQGTDKSNHIGKGAWSDGERVLDLYKLKGDTEFNYLYARSGWEGQMYVCEEIVD